LDEYVSLPLNQLNISQAELDTLPAEEAATRYPNLINMRGSVDTVKQGLADALEEIWKEISESLLESRYISMPCRVAAVIKSDGWYTKY